MSYKYTRWRSNPTLCCQLSVFTATVVWLSFFLICSFKVSTHYELMWLKYSNVNIFYKFKIRLGRFEWVKRRDREQAEGCWRWSKDQAGGSWMCLLYLILLVSNSEVEQRKTVKQRLHSPKRFRKYLIWDAAGCSSVLHHVFEGRRDLLESPHPIISLVIHDDP